MKMPSVCTVKVLAIQFAMSVKVKQPYNQRFMFLIYRHIYLSVIIIYMFCYEHQKCTNNSSVYQLLIFVLVLL